MKISIELESEELSNIMYALGCAYFECIEKNRGSRADKIGAIHDKLTEIIIEAKTKTNKGEDK